MRRSVRDMVSSLLQVACRGETVTTKKNSPCNVQAASASRPHSTQPHPAHLGVALLEGADILAVAGRVAVTVVAALALAGALIVLVCLLLLSLAFCLAAVTALDHVQCVVDVAGAGADRGLHRRGDDLHNQRALDGREQFAGGEVEPLASSEWAERERERERERARERATMLLVRAHKVASTAITSTAGNAIKTIFPPFQHQIDRTCLYSAGLIRLKRMW